MADHWVRVETTSSDDVPARITRLLAQRRMRVRALHMSRRPGDDGWAIQVIVDMADHTEVELLVKRLNRLIDVIRVVHDAGPRLARSPQGLARVDA
jgi:acetolactate synthase regulatory subunit